MSNEDMEVSLKKYLGNYYKCKKKRTWIIQRYFRGGIRTTGRGTSDIWLFLKNKKLVLPSSFEDDEKGLM